jgi:hypothetical protein
MDLNLLDLLFVDVFILALFSTFGSSFIFNFIVLVFPLELLAVISTIPDFFATTSPVVLTVATLSSLDFHVILLSVALSGVIVAVNILLFPTFILSIFSFICIPVTAIVDVSTIVIFVFRDEELDVLLVLDDELDEYGQTPLVCK